MVFNFLKSLKRIISEKTKEAEHQIIPYGLLGLFGFVLFYFFNSHVQPGGYENICLRFIAAILCFFLIFKDYWPQKFKKFIPIYWNFTIFFNIPFFFTFMMLKNPTNPIWPLYGVLALTVLIILVDWLSFSILTILGTSLGAFCYILSTVDPQLPDNFSAIMVVYLSVIIYSVLFSKKNQSAHQEKLQTMKMLAGSIAHELRTPLSTMAMGARALGRILPIYQEAYTKAKSANLLEKTVDRDQETYLANLPQNMQTVSQNAQTVITMLLTNLNEGAANQKLELCSMALCVKEALRAYPFSPDERRLVHWQDGRDDSIPGDFSFLGHQELMKHVLFNLLKNALYAIASAGKGEIFISLASGEEGSRKTHQLVFRDTGSGIPPQNLRHIFDRFYTRTEHGSGIGLAFCQSVVQSFGGEITCASRLGEHTTFTLSFPLKHQD